MLGGLISKIFSDIVFLALHVAGSGSFPPPLSAKKEEEYIEKYQNGDMEARNKLIEHNLRLVAHIVKKYYSVGSNQDDLISIGTIGLIKAVSTYKPGKGIKLATYSARCIENEILMYFRSLRKTAQDVSINEALDTDKDGNALTLMDIISDDRNIADEIDTKIKIEKLNAYMQKYLTPRERAIIEMRYGLGGKEELTQRQVAQKLKISRSYVSRIEKSTLIKLRKAF